MPYHLGIYARAAVVLMKEASRRAHPGVMLQHAAYAIAVQGYEITLPPEEEKVRSFVLGQPCQLRALPLPIQLRMSLLDVPWEVRLRSVVGRLPCMVQKPVEFDQAISYVNKIKVRLLTDQLTIQPQTVCRCCPLVAFALHSQQRWHSSL